MSATPQVIGHGSSFVMGAATPFTNGVYAPWTATGETASEMAINGATQIDFGSDKVDTQDTTDIATPGTTRVYTPGLRAPGDLTLKLNLKPGDPSQIALHASEGVLTDFKFINAVMGITRSFAAILTSWDPSFPDDKVPTISAKFQISGPITDTNF